MLAKKKKVDDILKALTKSVNDLKTVAEGNRKDAKALSDEVKALETEAERAEKVVKNFHDLLAIPQQKPLDDSKAV